MAIAKRARVLGNALGLTINGQDYWADVAKYELVPSDSDKETLTFADAAAGGGAGKWTMKVTAIISFETGSFWDMVWANTGKEVPFILAPMGNKTATSAKPHFKGKVKIGVKPALSSEAGDEKGATFEVEWNLIGEPEKVTQTSTMGAGNLEDSLGA